MAVIVPIWDRSSSFYLEANKPHTSQGIAAAIFTTKSVRHEIDGDEPPKAERKMLGDLEVSDRTGRYLADGKGRPVILPDLEKLPILGEFAPGKHRPARALQ